MVEAKSREDIDLLAIAKVYGELKRQGKEWYMICPIPEHHDTDPSCSFNTEKQMWYCHGCKEGGDVFDLLMEIHNVDFRGAIDILRDKHNISYKPMATKSVGGDLKVELRTVVHWAAEMFYDYLRGRINTGDLFDRGIEEHKVAIAYLNNRGFDLGDITRSRMGYSPNYPYALAEAAKGQGVDRDLLVKAGVLRKDKQGYADVFHSRIILPVRDNSGRPIGFVARRITGSLQKYLNTMNTPIFEKHRILMNWDQAIKYARRTERLFIVEGPLDLLRMIKIGLPETVCTMGTSLSSPQIDLISDALIKKVILFGDGDGAGRIASLKRGENLLIREQKVYVVKTPEGQDPDSLGKGRSKLCQSLLDLPNTFIQFAMDCRNPQDAMERAETAEYFRDLLGKIPSETWRALLAQEVSQFLDIPFEAPVRKTLPTPTPSSTTSTPNGVRRIELDIIYAIAKHWQEPAVVEMIFQVIKSLPKGVFSDAGNSTISYLLSKLPDCNGDFDQIPVPEEAAPGRRPYSIIQEAIELNKSVTPDWNVFLRVVTQWTTIEAVKKELDLLKEKLGTPHGAQEGTVSILTEYIETSKRRINGESIEGDE